MVYRVYILIVVFKDVIDILMDFKEFMDIMILGLNVFGVMKF